MIAAATSFRTIWLMGSKTRIIPDFIESAVADLLPAGGTLLDLCAGTGVVGRSLAHRYSIIANDVHRFSSILASAHLEGDSAWADAIEFLDADADLAQNFAENLRLLEDLLPEACATERALLPRVVDELSAREPGAAASSYREFLLQTPEPEEPHESDGKVFEPFRGTLAAELIERKQNHSSLPYSLITLYYQNVYFGVRQAMVLDSLRSAIARIPAQDPFCERKRTLYLGALLYAASVSTSGTSHFAQPRSVRKEGELLAVAKRRLIDIEEQFATALDAIRREWGERPRGMKHRVFQLEAERLLAPDGPLHAGEVGLVYFDPPYTADNYSRFYHVLETLVSYDYPELEKRGGVLTRGRYPQRARRYQSTLSSAQQVEGAFRRIVERVHQLGARLLVSYSPDSGLLFRQWMRQGASEPQARFRELFRERYESVEMREMTLLHSGQGDSNRSVREVLVLCEP